MVGIVRIVAIFALVSPWAIVYAQGSALEQCLRDDASATACMNASKQMAATCKVAPTADPTGAPPSDDARRALKESLACGRRADCLFDRALSIQSLNDAV